MVFFVLLRVEVEADCLVGNLSRTENVIHFLVVLELKIEILNDVIGCFESLLLQIYLTCQLCIEIGQLFDLCEILGTTWTIVKMMLKFIVSAH